MAGLPKEFLSVCPAFLFYGRKEAEICCEMPRRRENSKEKEETVMLTTRWLTKTGMLIGSALFALCIWTSGSALANQQILQTPLPGKNIPKYVEALPTFVGARVPGTAPLVVSMEEFQQKVLPVGFYTALPASFSAGTYVWGYKVNTSGPLYPTFTIEAQRGTPTTVTYTNNLTGPGGGPAVLQKYLTVDQTLHWADPLELMCVMNPMNPACFKPYGNPSWLGPGNPPNPTGAPVPAVVHLHGSESPSAFDGGPEQWFTPDPLGPKGAGYVSLSTVPNNQAVYYYPNSQEATTLWFHDHALGATRLNVYGGLAGFYFLRDGRDTGLSGNPIGLPVGLQEVEIVIQDRMFDTNGQLLFPDLGINPTIHPFWIPEFFGDTIVVNGKTWPYLQVEPKRYRFRVLNGSNARMYNLSLDNKMPFWQIGTDGGFLDAPAMVSQLFIAPGERADVIVDFTGSPNGTNILLTNDAKAPFPHGAPADPQTVGQIMQFRVTSLTAADASCNPALAAGAVGACDLRGTNPIVRLADPLAGTLATGVVPDKKRQLTLNEVMGAGGPLEVLLNNTRWMGLKGSTVGIPGVTPAPVTDSVLIPGNPPNWITELPQVGSTEEWEIINLTADAHPIHIHLVQFQIVNRQMFQTGKYLKTYGAAFLGGVFKPSDGPPLAYNTPNADGAVGGNPAVTPYLQDGIKPPAANEAGWKDTVVMHPGEVTRIVARWAPQNVPVGGVAAGTNLYPFDPRAPMGTLDAFGLPGGPGYVWHCHILDHEDNEMMRPYMVQ